ncbi:MAG TPA: response regulator [Spirochaetota bacterium]|nr:response regulator [Spirochaetota bacterium]HPC41131.1 response regulator [Spirochaetota bacterium]HPL15553.1 response regulator [Spirochaetota bacterium]HQF07051.1 response regulator [Spirochaetota bacterium]HQH95788.1 response regulator [Spirochaetota bacterium]
MTEPAEKKKILCVDDEIESRNLVKEFLSRKDYGPVTAANGAESLKTIGSEAVDLIPLDVMMPGENGFEICKRIKSDPASMGIPVIFITAASGIFDKVKGVQCGASDYIANPLTSRSCWSGSGHILRSAT